MEGSPSHIDQDFLKGQIVQIPGVLGVYEFRVWMVSESKVALSTKVLLGEYSSTIIEEIKLLCELNNISNSTIEPRISKRRVTKY